MTDPLDLDVPMTELRCLAPHPRHAGRTHGILLLKLYGFAEPTGRLLSRYEEVRKPGGGVRYVGVRCAQCARITEYRMTA